MMHRFACLCAVVTIASFHMFASTASAGIITATTLGSYSNPFVFDFQSPAEGNISGTDGYFTANGISSITAISSTSTDEYTSFPPSNKGLFHNQTSGSLLIDDRGGTARPFGNGTIFTINLAAAQHRIGFEILDQVNSTYSVAFFNGATPVGTTAFSYPASSVINYFHNTDLFDSVVILDTNSAGYGLDNVTIETFAPVPEPATMTLWALGSLGVAVGAYRRKRSS